MGKGQAMKQSCRTCQHYDLSSTKTATGRVMSASVASCFFDLRKIVLPDSVKKAHAIWNGISKQYMQPTDGVDCRCWLKVETKK